VIFGFGNDDRLQAATPPLARVIATLQYPLVAALSSMPAIAPIQERLASEFPTLRPDELNQMGITFNIASAPLLGVQQQQTKQTIWRFSGHEAAYEVVITPSAAQISVGSTYRDREQFAEVLSLVCDALIQGANITRLDGFSVRYVNAVPIEADWEQWWSPSILGWFTSPDLHAQQIFSITQTSLTGGMIDVNNHAQIPTNAIVRHGLVPGVGPDLLPDGAAVKSYVLDCELAMAQPMAFATNVALEMFRQYNHEIARFFVFALSETGRRHFGVEVRAQ
jgi:uncharacterized protein (TIGR04255 family)